MKETNLTRSHSAAVSRGYVAPTASRSFSWVEDMANDTGADILEGSVVVVLADGTIQLAATVNEPRPTGVALDTIDTGDTGQVCFGGPVDKVLTTSAVTAGQYGQTSTTAGKARIASGPSTAFCQFTETGTDVAAFLWGGRGGGGTASSGGSPDVPIDHGNMGATETIDVSAGTWHRGTLNANCTITVSGFTVDEGLIALVHLTQDGTGTWDITWDADVDFIGDDQPDQAAASVSWFMLWSDAGDSTIYGAKIGTSVVSALDDLSDVTLTSPATNNMLVYNGSVWVNSANLWRPVMDGGGAVVVDGSGQAVMAFGAP